MRRPLLLAAATALLCAGCAASGDGGKSGAGKATSQPGAPVRAATAALGKDTARVDQEIEISGGGEAYVISVSGGFDFAGDKGRLAVDFPEGGVAHADEVFADGRIYFNGAPDLREDSWAAIPRDKAEAHYLLRAPLNDPEHVLRQIAAMRQVSREGEEKIHGVRTVHYRGTLDNATLMLRAAKDIREQVNQARDILGEDLPVFADAWIDGHGRLVRTRLTVVLAGAKMTATMNLSGFGEPVHVTAPKPADTVPVGGTSGVLTG
ncbi:LppX_LprAFG lipoprotein [Streptomyces sp. NPDC005435]|uniref:LppX_LprAFG lipoprotein n=1 Tax=Streptomyces sp. NPDC005435 TaxID=3154464 RepID=UPI0034524F40